MVIVSDGGPDHCVTYDTAKVSAVALLCPGFGHVDLSTNIPYQLWQNIAKRITSTLNLPLQKVSLARCSMDTDFETLIHNKNLLSDIQYVKLYRKAQILVLL